jgi:hypothetical protein
MALSIAVWWLIRGLRRIGKGPDAVLAASAVGAALGYLVMSLTLWMLPYGQSNAFFLVLVGMVAGRLDHLSAARTRKAEAEPEAPASGAMRELDLATAER